jgi:hypothetical protein
LWDYAAGAVPKAWIRAFFGEFRNPFSVLIMLGMFIWNMGLT